MATILRYENSCNLLVLVAGIVYASVVCLFPTFHNSTIEGNNEIQLGDSENKVKTFF